MKASRVSLFLFTLAMVLGSNAYADLRVKSKYTTGGQSTETTVYTKDSRQRFDAGPGIAMLNQCDVQRSIQLFEQRKNYMVFPAGAQSMKAETPPPAPSPGGVVTYTVNIADTGERKTMFGYTARRMKSVSTKDAGPNTCNPGRETLEFDGWYIDYEPDVPMCLANTNKIQAPPSQPRCNDEVKVNQTGDGKLGYPLSYTLKTTKEDGSSTVMEMQVIDFSTSTLDNSLFEIPPGYSELKSTADFSAALGAHFNVATAPATVPAGPKPAGNVRVGVAELTNHSSASTGSARDQLIAALAALHVDAVPLQGQSSNEIEESAKKYEADYVLYTDVEETKKPSGALGKFGGVLNKASAISRGGTAGSTKEKVEAKVNYKLMQQGGSQPLISATSSGSNGGGFSLGSAVNLAANVTPMAMFMRMGLFNPNLMRLLSGANGFGAGTAAAGIPGMPRVGFAPGLGSFMPMLQVTQSLIGSSNEQTEESKAVADALNETAKSIAEALKKKSEVASGRHFEGRLPHCLNSAAREADSVNPSFRDDTGTRTYEMPE